MLPNMAVVWVLFRAPHRCDQTGVPQITIRANRPFNCKEDACIVKTRTNICEKKRKV